MAVDGKWEITINSPMGAQKAKLDLASRRRRLTGTQHGAQGSGPLDNGKVDGNNVSWSAKITSPMPMTLEFTGTVDGDKLSGSVKAGAFGSFPFSGSRNGLIASALISSGGGCRLIRDGCPFCFGERLCPFIREGWPFIALFAGVNLLAFLLAAWLGWLLLPLTIWCIAFFRDPERKTPDGDPA